MGASTRERGIIFSAPMVRALLAGKKTQTRRVIPHRAAFRTYHEKTTAEDALAHDRMPLALPEGQEAEAVAYLVEHCPYGAAGDRLWVRETFARCTDGHMGPPTVAYAATDERPAYFQGFKARWSSPIHMPRWASRITLEVESVRVERLQEISADDAAAEGMRFEDGSYELEWMTANERDRERLKVFAEGWDRMQRRISCRAFSCVCDTSVVQAG